VAAGALFGVGAAAVVTGVVLVVVGVRKNASAARAQLTPVIGPTHAGASLKLSF
jgi:hypothetical protein